MIKNALYFVVLLIGVSGLIYGSIHLVNFVLTPDVSWNNHRLFLGIAIFLLSEGVIFFLLRYRNESVLFIYFQVVPLSLTLVFILNNILNLSDSFGFIILHFVVVILIIGIMKLLLIARNAHHHRGTSQ